MNLIRGKYRYADAHDMYALLGTRTLPPEGMPERIIQGVRVYVKPLPAGPPRQRQSLRVTAICECGKHVPVGRMHQHLPIVVRRFNSDEVVGRFCSIERAEAFIDAQLDAEGGVYMIGGKR
jgi:hypothetical protein